MVTGSDKEESEVPHGAVVGVRRRGGHTSEVQGESHGDEVDGDAISRLPGAPETEFAAVQDMRRESLMLQQFANAHIDVLAEFGDRGLRRGTEYQRHHAGQHPRKRL